MDILQLPDPQQAYTLGRPWVSGPLHLFPILAREPSAPLVVALVDAPPGVEARELPDGGNVNQIEIVNESDYTVVLFDGDAILGCKQDRIADGTCLVPPRSVERVAVCCIERGRWHGSDESRFAAATFRAPVSLRRSKAASRVRGASVQARVWREVEQTLVRSCVRSTTSTLTAVFEREEAPEIAASKPEPGQVGVVVALGARIEGVDLFDSPETYAALHSRLVRSYALDADHADAGSVSVPEVDRFLANLFSAPRRVDAGATGATRGARFTLHSPREVEGHALALGGRLVHLSACTPTHETLIEAEGERAPRNSVTDPIAVSWVKDERASSLGLTFAPGKCDESVHGARWKRDLEADLVRLKFTYEVETLVCLLSDRELQLLGIEDYERAVQRMGLELLRLPTRAGDVPEDLAALEDVVAAALERLGAGQRVVVHSRAGLGRAGTVGGCLLAAAGLSADEALEHVRVARGSKCPENDVQRQFVRGYAAGVARGRRAPAPPREAEDRVVMTDTGS